MGWWNVNLPGGVVLQMYLMIKFNKFKSKLYLQLSKFFESSDMFKAIREESMVKFHSLIT